MLKKKKRKLNKKKIVLTPKRVYVHTFTCAFKEEIKKHDERKERDKRALL